MDETKEMLVARDEFIELIRKELLGPGSEISIPDAEHELITNSPEVRYSIGILFPRENKMNADNGDSVRVKVTEEITLEEFDENESSMIPDSKEKKEVVDPVGEENLDEEIGLAAQNMPSSMGITFFARGDVSKILCKLSFATYRKATPLDCKVPFFPAGPESYAVHERLSTLIYFDSKENCLKLCSGELTRRMVRELVEADFLDPDEFGIFNCMYKLCDQLKNGYVRVPHSVDSVLEFSNSDYIDNNSNLDGSCAKLTALRRKISDNLYSITIMLVNDDDRKSNGTRCIFQPELRVDTVTNNFVFHEYSGVGDFLLLDDEEQALELQYRNKKVYGTGLGTSINWFINENGEGIIFNDFFPTTEVPAVDFSLPGNAYIDSCTLSMKFLSDLDGTPKMDKVKHLKSLVIAYGEWINELSEVLGTLEQKYNYIASKNIAGCRNSLSRMQSGIRTMEDNSFAWEAFQLANRSMFMQRVHLKLQEMTSKKERFPDDEELSELLEKIDYNIAEQIIPDNYSWRPFQLGFLLMSIDSITDDRCQDRDIVDLIWFPTGGGKTEAYLGLTAFTIFYRRLNNLEVSSGTTVIMRYTLRLLAAQQFTRASTLICACEYIRKDSAERRSKYKAYALGKDSITIGLWIGSEHTPNKIDKAKEHLRYLLDATPENLRDAKDKHNKFQVLKCPWCGTKLVRERRENRIIGTFGYRMRNNRHFELWCPQESCFFNQQGKLPIQIIDQELYAAPPTLLFGTVDKFAMIPWKKEIGSFFAIGSNNRAPELIIQDELHLISGPLGTMVGLYETAIDALCSSKGTKVKIVASTATIRRAKEQCAALYNRAVNQFPHPGLNAEDSFFARESVIDYQKGVYGRKYIGLMPSGKTKAMMEVRSIAALLQKLNLMSISDDIKDKFWTLTVYFNSLKDLGKCRTLVDDDVKDFILRTAKRLGTAKDARMIGQSDELTSRVPTSELNETLDKLEKHTYSKENKWYASNVLLATNMISVGLDVKRLNTMLLVGQPKLTSEYIQASSRIGRSYPGVAFTLYDGSKSRDRSHYEQFKPYHESFYKYVEPTGATPFSKPARDRALHAVIISLLRFLEPELSSEKGAAKFTRDKYRQRIEDIRRYILSRNSDIINRLNLDIDDDSLRISNEIDIILEKWERFAEDYDKEHFCYGEKYLVTHPEEVDGRLLKAFNTDRNDGAFDTMTSMRNVDASIAGNILIWED